MHSILTMVTLLLLDLMIITLMGHPSRMILQCPNTSGHMLLEYLIRHWVVIHIHVPVILVLQLRFLPTLAMTTTVRLVTMLLVIHKHFSPIKFSY